MPITPYLAGQAFEPELIREMALALQNVCDTLKLRLTDDQNEARGVQDYRTGTAWSAGGGNSKHNDAERVQTLLRSGRYWRNDSGSFGDIRRYPQRLVGKA